MGQYKEATCGMLEFGVFTAALIAGTACSLTSKILLSMKAEGMTGEVEDFSFPLFQTFGMFIGMTFALLLHFIILKFQIPFPGYSFPNAQGQYIGVTGDVVEAPKPIPMWMYFLLIIPSIFDLVATALCMFGLRYVNVSIFQMLRGGAIVFVAILKQFVLQHRLCKFQWVGVGWNVVSIVLVGVTAMLSSSGGNEDAGEGDGKFDNPLVGVTLILMGAFVQSLQYAFEEKVMNMDIPAPPMLLTGMEGLWGTIICVLVLYPAAYYTPGIDHGCVENPFNTYYMIAHSPSIQWVFVLYFVSVFVYNVLGCLVTFMLSSVWHAILDNFRPITVWGTDLFIFYIITTAFGESWTVWSFIQLFGMFVLLYGTAIYNAPNPGSLKLTGKWYHLFFNFSNEYEELEEEQDSLGDVMTTPVNPPFRHNSLPFMSPSASVRRSALPSPYVGLRGAAHDDDVSYGGVDNGDVAMKPIRNKQKSFA